MTRPERWCSCGRRQLAWEDWGAAPEALANGFIKCPACGFDTTVTTVEQMDHHPFQKGEWVLVLGPDSAIPCEQGDRARVTRPYLNEATLPGVVAVRFENGATAGIHYSHLSPDVDFTDPTEVETWLDS